MRLLLVLVAASAMALISVDGGNGTAQASVTTPAMTGGAATVTVQHHLVRLGYLPPRAISRRMDDRTRQALLAFQGWEGLRRTGRATPATHARLASAARPKALPRRGRRIEIHLRAQVALLVRGGTTVRAIHISTGAPATPTPPGEFRVFRKERSSWSAPFRVWLPWTSYFNRGIALHGYPDVPAYPASHGCVRIPLSDAPTVYRFARLGATVDVVP